MKLGRNICKLFFACLIGQCMITSIHAEVILPHLISDGMVLQRNTPVNIWGWASPGERLSVTFRNKTYTATTGSDGKWKITMKAMKEGGPFEMKIDASNHIVLHDILVGDVWVCTGQSNMVLPMERVKEKYPDEIAASKNAFIRHYFLPTRANFKKPEEDTPPARWESADPTTVLRFSASAYFFAKNLYDKYHVPVGLINSSVGGPPVESWMSEEALQSFPKYLAAAGKFKDSLYVDSILKLRSTTSSTWYGRINKEDSGLNGTKPWYDTSFAPTNWSTLTIPGYWSDQGLKRINGVLWFRKEVDIPASMAGKPAKLFLGCIVDADYTYVNGALVGNITYRYPPRRYEVKAGILKAGKNIIMIRVINSGGKGGFVPEKKYALDIDGRSIDLKGEWQYKIGIATTPMPPMPGEPHYQPLGLYNSMIAPLINYTMKGVAWYQGEGNTGRPGDYSDLLSAMIADWRKKWNEGSFPFIIVQLHNFGERNDQPVESGWAELREQQRLTLSVPNTAMVSAIDLGEWNDLHPLNKKDVGARLALAARALAYGDKKVVYSGPLYQSMKIGGNKVILSFKSTGTGLIAKNGEPLRYFAIAGADRKFVWANARIEGNKVIVWNDAVASPVIVRYAWADNPEGANLYNKEGLPASSFQATILNSVTK